MQLVNLNLAPVRRAADVRAGIRWEIVTVAWMAVEAVVAIGAGVLAHSVLLTAFGIDSVIELVSGGPYFGGCAQRCTADHWNALNGRKIAPPGQLAWAWRSCACTSS